MTAAGGALAKAQAQEEQGLLDRFSARAQTGASFVSAYVDDVFDAERRLAARVKDDGAQPETFARSAELLGFSAAVLLDSDGRAVALAPDNPDMHGADLTSSYEHLAVASAGERAVSDIVPSAVEGEPIVALALPLRDWSGQPAGVLSAGLSLESSPLKAFLERQPIPGTRGYVLDSRGTVVVSAGEGAPPFGTIRALPAASSTSIIAGRLVASAPIAGTPWVYVLDAPVTAVLAPLKSSGFAEWAVLAGLAAVTLIGAATAAAALSARSRARLLQAEADRRFRLTVEHAPIGMTMVSLERRFVEPNARLCRMLGFTADELESMTLDEVTHADDLQVDLDNLERLIAGETDSYELDKRYVRKDGSVLWGRMTRSAVRDDGGQPLYFVTQVEDVTTIRAAQEDLERRALYDPLTGLANRSLLVDRLHNVLHSRASTSVAVAYCDLDYFKQINDTHGHHVGDAVLKEVARRLHNSVRGDDTVARMGGDEFVLLLAEVGSLEAAREVIDRAQRCVTETPIEFEDLCLAVGLSGGLAFADAADSADSLLRKADEALYSAKLAGRGRFEVRNEAESSVGAQPVGTPSPR